MTNSIMCYLIDRRLITELKVQLERQQTELLELRSQNDFNKDGENKRPAFLLFQRFKKAEQELQARYAYVNHSLLIAYPAHHLYVHRCPFL
jgi:hypothetical protein